MTDHSFFADQGRISRPGAYAGLFTDLPADIAGLCKTVQGTTIHIFWAERYGLELLPERKAEVQLRTMEKRLARMMELDPRPLAEPRPPERKVVGNCRDHSLMLVSMLRHQGIPARARCGFATYFMPDHYEDHWVAEYWDKTRNRWVLADPQLDEFQCRELSVSFDPLDVPRDMFIVAGEAWKMCRSGAADPASFGIFDMKGMGFIRGNLLRDMASLNKVELLPWDCWGLILAYAMDDDNLKKDDLALLDKAASLTEGEARDFDMMRNLYETDPRLAAAGRIRSYQDGKMIEVDV